MAAVGLCSQLWIDTHITPNTDGNAGTVNLATQLDSLAEAAGCQGARLVILEENKCSNHFQRALENAGLHETTDFNILEIVFVAGAAAGLQSSPTIAAAATSQCWTAAAHADGCGEGHIIRMQSRTFAAPPFYASQMTYASSVPMAVIVEASQIASAQIPHNLTVFAGMSSANLVLRVVNDNSVGIHANTDQLQPNAISISVWVEAERSVDS